MKILQIFQYVENYYGTSSTASWLSPVLSLVAGALIARFSYGLTLKKEKRQKKEELLQLYHYVMNSIERNNSGMKQESLFITLFINQLKESRTINFALQGVGSIDDWSNNVNKVQLRTAFFKYFPGTTKDRTYY